jgi:hypothetical protein
MRREKIQINKIRVKKGDNNTKEIHRITGDDFEKPYSNNLENLEEMDRFLDTYAHPELNKRILTT